MLRLRRFFRPAAPPNEPNTVRVDLGEDAVEVVLKRRGGARRMTLRVSGATGDVVLTLPARATLTTARSFLDAHAGWIAQRLSRLPERTLFVPGAEVPLRGVPHLVVHRPRTRAATSVGVDEGGRAIIAVSGLESAVPGRVRRFLLAEAEADLRLAAARHAAILGVPVKRITLRDTRSRWGSCSSTGALSFSWRLILAPPFVLDYLAAHEVSHLKEMNHSARFWRVVRSLCPHTDEAEAWLNRNGSGLHRYG